MAYSRNAKSTGYVRSKDYSSNGELHDEPDYHDYEIYGQTPPRTRILRKNRERKQKDRESFGDTMSKPTNLTRSKKALGRRNTVSIMFDELIARADNNDVDQGKRTTDKRVMKLIRGSERDLKLDIISAQNASRFHDSNGDDCPKTPLPSIPVEGCKRFKSLCSKLVSIPRVVRREPLVIPSDITNEDSDTGGCPLPRVEFHRTLSMLLKMGFDKQAPERSTKRNMSREESIWLNEQKDLIWLELQAWHADRTPLDQDSYVCAARDSVGSLLDDIMSYRYVKRTKRVSVASQDSGVEEDCTGCLSMYCQICLESQNQALREVECLMNRLENAEALFPSSKAFGEAYPLYASKEFVDRVKAMCLWYNMTKHQRLKLVILGRLLALLDNKYCQWPSIMLYDGDSIDSSSPSDSNSSNSSINDYFSDKGPFDLFNITPISLLLSKNIENKTSPYRKYIENILKTKGLSKSMSFLERLHNHVLKKAQFTLHKPDTEEVYTQNPQTEEEELLRYGIWSPEAKSLCLPSYRSSFLFLSCVPLEVTHEFLRMRLEQKPENPSPLSVRQLMRELKEGLKIAILHRNRTTHLLDIAFNDTCESRDKYTQKLVEFDNSLFQVFKLYLQYLEQWALLQPDPFQKQFLEDEWNFVNEISADIPRSQSVASKMFCSIMTTMLKNIGERLMERIEELCQDMNPKNDVFNKKQTLFIICREFQALFNEEREITIKTISFTKNLFKQNIDPVCQDELKESVVALKCCIPNAIDKVQSACDIALLQNLDESEKQSLLARWREILSQGYRFGFEFYKEMSQFVPGDRRTSLAKSMVQFAHLWMKFVKERCERGRGKRPQWAYQGLDFLLTVCEPFNTKYLTDEEFDELRICMDECISHVIGTTAPSTPESGVHSSSPRASLELIKPFSRSRASSPSPRPNYKSQRSTNRKTSIENSPLSDNVENPPNFLKKMSRSDRVKDAVEALDAAIDEKLKENVLIGKVVTKNSSISKAHIRKRYVPFTWQRGIKIGQGRFGKVYTAVNNKTGEMMAMKEIALQHNDMHTILRVAEELKILEGIVHKNLVRYYGLEIHREEMLIFMEFCAAGTLESLVAGTEGGLPELLIRKYTFQLVSGVAVLHDHGIVHRDIKSANVFLNDEGDLKIGDFGCAIQIKANVTMPGELQGFVGTQAYMAPEMFMKMSTEGHGRAADIWSIGCVVVEMASGERPWAQYDSNYQIMFKVGMGERPKAPDSLIMEGHQFLDMCLQHDPKDRATAVELLNHDFIKGGDDYY